MRQPGVGRHRAAVWYLNEWTIPCKAQVKILIIRGLEEESSDIGIRCRTSVRATEYAGGLVLRLYGEGAGEDFTEGNDGFGAKHSHGLEFVVDEVEQVLVVVGVDLHEHVVGAGGEVNFGDFGHYLEFLDYVVEGGSFLEVDTHEGASVVAQGGGLDQSARTFKDIGGLEFCDALVNGSTADATFAGDFKERLATVVDKHLKNFGVQFVNL